MREPTEREARLLDAAVVTGGLGPRYSQPHREYHNLMHIEDVLLRIEELEPPVEHELALALAAWFHDAVYQPGKDDNEDRSAYVAYDALEQVGASPDLIAEVVRLVRLDRAPRSCGRRRRRRGAVRRRPRDPCGARPTGTREYAAAIRQEYVARPGGRLPHRTRRACSAASSSGPTIYRTAYGREHWEARAPGPTSPPRSRCWSRAVSEPAAARRRAAHGVLRLDRPAGLARVLGDAARRRDVGRRATATRGSPSGVGPRLDFLRVPEVKTLKNRLHLDIAVTDVGTGDGRGAGARRHPGRRRLRRWTLAGAARPRGQRVLPAAT